MVSQAVAGYSTRTISFIEPIRSRYLPKLHILPEELFRLEACKTQEVKRSNQRFNFRLLTVYAASVSRLDI